MDKEFGGDQISSEKDKAVMLCGWFFFVFLDFKNKLSDHNAWMSHLVGILMLGGKLTAILIYCTWHGIYLEYKVKNTSEKQVYQVIQTL